jgi:DedD protein
MAKAISSEELQLKKRARRRLVGAIALVLFVIVFLPMVLDNEPRQMSQDISINIPALPEENSAVSASSEPLRFKPVEPSAAIESASPAAQPKPRQQVRAPSRPRVADKPVTRTKSASVKNEGFIVQLGAFSNSENATRLAGIVRESKFKAYTEVVSTTQGDRTRVRVGPYATRSAAEEARERLKRRKLTFGEPTIVRLGE